MDDPQAQHKVRRRRKRHSRKKSGSRSRVRGLWRGFWVIASAVCVSASIFLFLFDDQLRKPATDDSDGDPPTKFMVWAIAVAILALLCILAALFGGRKKEEWPVA